MDIVSLRDATLSRVAKPRQILLALALAFASTLAMTIAPPAQAQPRAQTEAQIACPANRICLYDHINFGGRVAIYATGSSDMRRFGPPFNNRTSSIVNNTGARWCAYDNANYQGLLLTIAPRQRIPWVGAANDRIGSLRKC